MWGINQSCRTDWSWCGLKTLALGQFCVVGPLKCLIIISWLTVFTIIITLLMNLICSGKKAHLYTANGVKLAFVIGRWAENSSSQALICCITLRSCQHRPADEHPASNICLMQLFSMTTTAICVIPRGSGKDGLNAGIGKPRPTQPLLSARHPSLQRSIHSLAYPCPSSPGLREPNCLPKGCGSFATGDWA